MRRFVLLLAVAFICSQSKSQKQQRCAMAEVIKQQAAADPSFAKKLNEARKNAGNYQRKQTNSGRPVSITIPVAVHVVYNSAEENITDEQVQSQIDVINEDYSATNSDYNNYDAGYSKVKGDLDIKFCLVKIIRKQTNHKSFPLNDAMKFTKRGGSDAYDPEHVLNIWCCHIDDRYLGYAYIPGTISADRFGVVCHYKAFGRGSQFNLYTAYNLGRTVTHEMGHSLGLEHIWGDAYCGNDLVDDTPLQDSPNYGCPGEGHKSLCTGTPLEMWMNYMDYTDDKCMYFFSDGQGARASYFLENDPLLKSIASSSCAQSLAANNLKARTGIIGVEEKHLLQLYPSVTQTQVNLRIQSETAGYNEVRIVNLSGKLVYRQSISIVRGENNRQLNVSSLPAGLYFVEMNLDGKKEVQRLMIER